MGGVDDAEHVLSPAQVEQPDHGRIGVACGVERPAKGFVGHTAAVRDFATRDISDKARAPGDVVDGLDRRELRGQHRPRDPPAGHDEHAGIRDDDK